MVLDSAKKWWGGAEKEVEDKGWNISGKFGSAASSVKSYSSSAASSVGSAASSTWNSAAVASGTSAVSSATKSTASYIGSTAKSAWNSEAVASGTAAVGSATSGIGSWWNGSSKSEETQKKSSKIVMDSPKNRWAVPEKEEKEDKGWNISGKLGNAASTVKTYSSSAASSVGSAASSTWNSDAVASGTSAVGSATSGIWSWWNGSSKSEETESTSKDALRGGIAALGKNASKYVVQTSGRSSNILNIFDKTSTSSLGNPRWWIRFDRPHGNVNYHHINVNPRLTGVPDPHIRISPTTASAVGYFGRVAEKANDLAPMLVTAAMIYDAVTIGGQAKKDYDHGTTRNTVQAVATTTGRWTSGSLGASVGGVVGSTIFPGIGTLLGAVVGGVLGGVYGGHYSHVASEMALNHVEWDVATLECHGCKEEYTWKKYQEIRGVCCTPFSRKNLDYWNNRLDEHQDFGIC